MFVIKSARFWETKFLANVYFRRLEIDLILYGGVESAHSVENRGLDFGYKSYDADLSWICVK